MQTGQNLLVLPSFVELSPLPLLKFGLLLSVISELMLTCLDDRMVNTSNGRAKAENSQENRSPPLPASLAQAIASIHKSHDEQTKLLQQLMANSTCGGNGASNAPAPASTTYSDFAATHPLLFTKAGESLRPTIGFVQSSLSLGSYSARRCRRLSPLCSSYVLTPACGGPTTHPLAPWTTRCRGLSSALVSTPTTFPQA
jgi:hypothetical protein